jgi:hypothetical protein
MRELRVMSLGAHVGSVEAILRLRAAVTDFIAAADKALCESSIEIDRTADWISHDQQAFWTSEARKRHEAVVKAQDEVRRAQWTIGEHKPAAIEQKKALKKAEARLAEAKEKLANVARWKREFAQAGNEYKGQVQHLASALDADLPHAAATLEQILGSIESYLAVQAPAGAAEELDAASTAQSMAQPPAPRRPLEDPAEKAVLSATLWRRAKGVERHQVEIVRGLVSNQSWESPPAPLQFLEGAKVNRSPNRPGDLVVIEKAALLAADDDLFFARLRDAVAGDSGWHIGRIADKPPEGDLVATSASRVNLLRPDWTEVLAAEPGTMLLVRKGQLEVVTETVPESDS